MDDSGRRVPEHIRLRLPNRARRDRQTFPSGASDGFDGSDVDKNQCAAVLTARIWLLRIGIFT